MSTSKWAGVFIVFVWICLAQNDVCAQWNPPNPVTSFEKQSNGLEIRQKAGILRIEVNAPDLLHVTYSKPDGTEAHAYDGVVLKKDWPATSFDVTSDEKTITLSTAKLKVSVERESGAMHYDDAGGKQLTTEAYR